MSYHSTFGKILFSVLLLFFAACSSVSVEDGSEAPYSLAERLDELEIAIKENSLGLNSPRGSAITDIEVDENEKQIIIHTNKSFSNRYFREPDIDLIYSSIRELLGEYGINYTLVIKSLDVPIEELVPNICRKNLSIDHSRMPDLGSGSRAKNVVKNLSKPFYPTKGLNQRNIAFWHSHGYYYNHKYDRWMWQRARLFQMLEDIGPMSFTLQYIVPMLENAGANVFLPRERDFQTNEIVIDNEDMKGSFILNTGKNVEWKIGEGSGFKPGNLPYPANYNPFEFGSNISTYSDTVKSASAKYVPVIPEEGEYGIYISYNSSKNNVCDAHYTVYHLGGKTEFQINQQIGGNTWIYLGKFKFTKGMNQNLGAVELSNQSKESGKIVSTDAVRFGGGMGIVKRSGRASGKPKFVEGARYWLQYAGFPDTLIYNINGDTLDYNDDYQSRGEWVNYLIGSPFGPNKNREKPGLGIPIDLSFSFHTDAGITTNDTTIGTLAIYSVTDIDSNFVFPDGVSRFANRDLTDIVQTQIVEDIRDKYDPVWNRRALYDARYSEATRPNVPSVLLELLSHQNFLDCKFQVDPRFRFDVSRSIYKAILRFIAFQNNYDCIVQPLPVTHFFTSIDKDGNIKLNWRGQTDFLEPSAAPDRYIVYTRTGEGGFDNGVLVCDTTLTLTDLEEGEIYSFKVTAVNEGGESFPSEILSACSYGAETKPLLVINGFDRISGPASINNENFSGFLNFLDAGVPDKYDLSFTGAQNNFDPTVRWATDDMPGHGASYADYETTVIAGNSFDYPFVHGSAITAAGYPFVSCSDEAVWDKKVDISNYNFVDLILGEEKETDWPKDFTDEIIGKEFKTFPKKLQAVISEYLSKGGNLFVSGSYIGSDLFLNKTIEHEDVKFALDFLKYKLESDHSVRKGDVYSIDQAVFMSDISFEFNTELNNKLYAVEAPDALGSINGSKTILRYKENNTSAAVAFKEDYGVVVFGFPFETILDVENQKIIMKYILNYLMD